MDTPFTTATGSDIRVRFCPSPTGTPHVGLIRTALFNWAYARHVGGTFVFRIEDTDAERDSEESYEQLLDALSWLGLDWDEGVVKGGPHEPYRQSQRTEIYQDLIARLLATGHLYESYITPDEMEARNVAAGRDPKTGYDNSDHDLTDEQRAASRAEGRLPALRLRVPDVELGFDDIVRGPIVFPRGATTDFVVVRPNGQPLYTFVNPVDDALMGITHVLRGEDLLSSTPRQIALYHALVEIGVTTFVPRFGHLPYVMGEGNKKLSKRDPESNLFHHRDRGFIREGLLNYLSLLGWSISHDRDVFSIDEMIAAFDVHDVNPNPARFDLKKADSINGDHIRLLPEPEFIERVLPYLQSAGLVSVPASSTQTATLIEVAPLVRERVTVLSEIPEMVRFLFVSGTDFDFAEDALAGLDAAAADVLAASHEALSALETWSTATIEQALRDTLLDGMGLKPRSAFGAVRTAISGRRISPPLFESMEILGRQVSLDRIHLLRGKLI
ncbi:MAG: glutamate--tRNA ligase [Microbacteriaceae bacterium]